MIFGQIFFRLTLIKINQHSITAVQASARHYADVILLRHALLATQKKRHAFVQGGISRRKVLPVHIGNFALRANDGFERI